MTNLSSGSTITVSTLCVRDTEDEKDDAFHSDFKDGRLSIEHQIELNGTCIVCRSLLRQLSDTFEAKET
jgi:hypothetical protein